MPVVSFVQPGQQHCIVFAHGAGAGPDSEFMQTMGQALARHHYSVALVEFPYWTQVRESGKKRPPNPAKVLDEALVTAVRQVRETYSGRIVLAGKSMGARVACRIAEQVQADAVIAFGFPFHPPGKPEKHRLADLAATKRNVYIAQGARDPFGNQEWLATQALPEHVQIAWADAGNHDLLPPKRFGVTAQQRWHDIADAVHHWLKDME
ncbi:MAG: alpha/beta fold hydrolase [Idiomarina sp.]|nr:alpha/beta fold hydrolase [Idiomarina sp.]